MADKEMEGSFLTASIEDLVNRMSLSEKISLLRGEDWWRTVAVPRLNIPSVKITDGPNGARGQSFFKMSAWCPLAFTKTAVRLPGESGTVTVEMDKCKWFSLMTSINADWWIVAISRWDELTSTWRAKPGEWHVKIGRDAQTMCAEAPFHTPTGFEWEGL
ncbi:uncharacterized protein TrAFT101_006421 [Trichoderma asperellum]|uniref:uncharacterized protein n=1 Tax=Trichoderma asperellum TaxID=101201 RepID=UPI00332874DA|nr:hypothetical protein TrAFT101_006421 [Trichoderma asperellum]